MHSRVARLYKAGLRLYPKKFRDAYGEQMFMTAQDMLADTQTRLDVVYVMGRLSVDLFFTLIKENSKALGGSMKKHAQRIRKEPKHVVALTGLQLTGVLFLSFMWLSYVWLVFNAIRHTGDSLMSDYFWSWGAQLIGDIVLIMPIPLAFLALYRVVGLSLWHKVTWSYSLGLLGTAGYLVVIYIANSVSLHYTKQNHDYEWLLGIVFMTGFYFLMSKLVKRTRRSLSKV